MKRFIFAYIAFACVFLFLFSKPPKYQTDQVGTFITEVSSNKAPSNCTGPNRGFVYLYQRPDKSTYYYCTSEYQVPPAQTHTEFYMSVNKRAFYCFLGAFIVSLIVFFFKPFVHYLNT